jgi:putative nucleotidyltransferase with HDIG domain
VGYGIAVQDSDPVTEARAETAPTPRLRTRTRASRSSGVWLGLGFALIASLVQGVALLVPWGELPGLGAEVGLALAGFGLLQFLIVLALTTFLRTFGQPRLRLLRTQVGVLATMLLVAVVARGLLVAFEPSPLWLPVALAPLWTAVNFDRRAGFVVAVSMALVLASLVGFDSVVLCVLLARGMSATLTFLGRRSASGVLLAGVRAGGTAGLVLVAVYALGGRPLTELLDASRLATAPLLATVGGGLLEGVLAVLLRPAAVRLLGYVSRERLLQLTDLEQPLLQRLAQEAPGTFEHSRAMANLAEQAASAIGADALLTRVGAYYHDLGKTIGSNHFVENLAPGEPSPHDRLSPEQSARRIVRHVVEGTRILREGGIPEPVVEFAYTHHGTQTIEYFLNKHRQQVAATGAPELPEETFRYPGMKPQTKETAILMLVDSIEAASRTIDPPDRLRFRQMVHQVVQTKLEQGQLDECNLSLAELRIIQARMVETLAHMHHHRVKYPWQAERAEQFGVPASAVSRAGPGECTELPAATAAVVPIGRGARQ